MTNPHLLREPVVHGSAGTARLVVYAVHGRGQTADYMADVVDRIGMDDVAWILPSAHEDSWYPLSFLAPPVENQPMMDHALDAVRTHLDRAAGFGPPVAVMGFSQGACLLSEYLLRDQPRLAGAVLHTGGYAGPEERAWNTNANGGLAGLKVSLFTAREDGWVPLNRVEATARSLHSLGCRVKLTTYDDPEHHFNQDSIDSIRRFLTEQVTVP